MHLDPKTQLLRAVDVVDLVKQRTHPDWSGNEKDKLVCPLASTRHENGDDSSPSLSINPHTGAFNCFGCGFKGTSILGYITDVEFGGDFNKALASLYSQYVRSLVPISRIESYHSDLLNNVDAIQAIMSIRGWTQDTIRRFKLGWYNHEKRVVIPIFNLDGMCLDYRMHDAIKAAPLVNGKRIKSRGSKQSKTGDIFPISPDINPFEQKEIWILEGEPDVILGTQEGLNCVTITGGASALETIGSNQIKDFADKDIVLCLDNDKAGQTAAFELAKRLSGIGVASLKNIKVPEGKDLSDYLTAHNGSIAELKQIASYTKYLVTPSKKSTVSIPLSETGKAEYIGSPIQTKVIVSGKSESPQAVPKKLKLVCKGEKCPSCPCKSSGESDWYVDACSPSALDWLLSKDYAATAKGELGASRKCLMTAEVLEWQNLQRLSLIPSLGTNNEEGGAYTTRLGYFVGHDIDTNKNYIIVAIPTVHPKTKESVLVVTQAAGTQDSIEEFSLEEKEIEQLKKLFNQDPARILKEIANEHAQTVTHIYGRPDVHIVVDIALHSPREFTISSVRVPKGSMELLLFGDTRCGKGQIAEGLIRYYGAGTVVSGENTSFMGLCGGAQKVNDAFSLSWGIIPINNGRAVVIDEFSGLSTEVLSKLSRVRSEGIAEINKGGIHSKTHANTRLIWIANPRNGREVSSFPNGASAIMDLIGTNEDVARFDLAVVVQKNEVTSQEINAIREETTKQKYGKEILRKVLLWAWSRKSDHVIFTKEATEDIFTSAIDLAEIYSPTIPLIQGENARFKIAKIAAAIAARSFSTKDGIRLLVTSRHVKLAIQLINMLYTKPSMGYRQYSEVEHGSSELIDVTKLDDFFKPWTKQTKTNIVDGLLSLERFSVRELQDWCDVDAQVAKKYIGTFVRCQAIKPMSQGAYCKKSAFIRYLRELRKILNDS